MWVSDGCHFSILFFEVLWLRKIRFTATFKYKYVNIVYEFFV